MGAVITTPITIVLSIVSTKSSDLEYWYKWIASYIYIELIRRRTKKRFDLHDMYAEHDPYKVCFLPPPEEVALESPLPESQLVNSADEVFFYGMNSKSECLTVRLARGRDDESEAFVRLRLEDGRTYELRVTRGFQQSCGDKRVFSCGDLQLRHLSPMRRWRIFFNGLMRETGKDIKSPEKMIHVKFSLLWKASSDIFDYTTDVNTKTLATAFAKSTWNHVLPPLEKLNNALNMYAQSGVILGKVTIEGVEDEHNLYLFGQKIRYLGKTSLTRNMELFHLLGWTKLDGRYVHLVEASVPNIIDKFRFGFIVQPTGAIESISDAAIPLEKSDMGKVYDLKANFHANGDLFKLNGKLESEQTHFQSQNGLTTINRLNVHLNSLEGIGIILKGKVNVTRKQDITKNPVSHILQVVPCVVHFFDEICQDSGVTGGKGSSLSKLTELSKEFESFVVPGGIVVTTAAYEKFLTEEIIEEIKNLEKCLYSSSKCEDIKATSQNVIKKIIESTMPESVHQEIVDHLQKAFPDNNTNTIKFAVRSSATGEDTELMSAAGQMDTYLGVADIEEIMSAVKKCWASQFSLCAVYYKRQNGQVLNSPMAVVVQQMVSCDVAGVLFTCEPLTGDPTQISITANYGLGESVVSGSEEPDTIELRRNEEDTLVVKNKIIGSKSRRIVIKENQEGTDIEEIPEHERRNCCLTDEMALRLGNLAVKLQKRCRSHRDVEWGYWKNNLHIFQSRPVTSGTGETDFEIDHELDAPLRVENDYFTVSNVGEVMPGAMSTLGSEVLMKYFSIVFQRPNYVTFQEEKRTKYFSRVMFPMYNHTMFSCIHLFRRIDDKASREANSIGVFGRLVDEEEMFDMAKARFGCVKRTKAIKIKENVVRLSNMLFFAKRRIEKCQKMYEGYRIPIEKYKTAQEMFDAMLYACTDLVESFGTHVVCSEASSIWNVIIFTILHISRGELNSDVYTDFAQLLTTCNEVESADVPAALEEISSYISKDIKPEAFKKMGADEAFRWLQSSKSEAGVKFREFLLKHGHRCLREFDIYSKTWQTDPSTLIQLLQNTVGNHKKDRTEKGKEDYKTLISKLKSPLNFPMRLLMRLLIPMSRNSVQHRECSKSVTIRALDEWRRGYARLAQLMAEEGRIPDEDLLFFMTVEDIKELLATRSSRIIAKANHRRRRHPILDKYIFPEISKGVPIPINLDNQPVIPNGDSLSMKGIPVSQGIAKGFIRVAVTLEEASLLQDGEILVTYSTDIGWSPYFPIVSGVVTELGGLLSHGAVVSREYGLPCIAGLHGATRKFQTGDYALLDGNKGILLKLPNPENVRMDVSNEPLKATIGNLNCKDEQ